MNKYIFIKCGCSMVNSSNFLFVYPQSTTSQPHFLILNSQFTLIQSQFSLIHPQFSIFNSSSSISGRKYIIFDAKCPQNSAIFNKMAASAACTACSFFQVWLDQVGIGLTQLQTIFELKLKPSMAIDYLSNKTRTLW